MRILTIGILIVVMFAFFGVGKAFYQDDNTIDIHSLTRNDSRLQWNSSIFTYKNTTINMSNSDVAVNRMVNIIYKYADTAGYTFFEIAKWGVEVGFRNPQWNYLWLMKWFVVILLVMLLIPCLILLPYIAALVYILLMAITELVKRIKNRRKTKWKIKK